MKTYLIVNVQYEYCPKNQKGALPAKNGSAPFRRLKGIFPGGPIEIGLQRFVCVIGDSITIHWLFLCYRLLQCSCKSNRLGSFGLPLSGTVVLSPCSGHHGNYLNRIHLEIGNSVCCVNPSFTAYFNSVLCSFVYNIGIISLMFTVDLKICNKFSDNSPCLFYHSPLSTAAP